MITKTTLPFSRTILNGKNIYLRKPIFNNKGYKYY